MIFGQFVHRDVYCGGIGVLAEMTGGLIALCHLNEINTNLIPQSSHFVEVVPEHIEKHVNQGGDLLILLAKTQNTFIGHFSMTSFHYFYMQKNVILPKNSSENFLKLNLAGVCRCADIFFIFFLENVRFTLLARLPNEEDKSSDLR
jgi:hypothetical protein